MPERIRVVRGDFFFYWAVERTLYRMTHYRGL